AKGGNVTTDLARRLRREASLPERATWRLLAPLRRKGVNFRRQVQIGACYVDFACHQPAIAIEIDGRTHDGHLAQSNDAVRDDNLRGRGYRVLRFGSDDVLRNVNGVFLTVEAALAERSASAAPPAQAPLGLRTSSATLPARGRAAP